MKWKIWIACIAGVALSQNVMAQSREGRWESRIGIGFQNSADADFEGGTSADLDSDTGLRLGLGYHYNDRLEFGGNLNFGQTDYDAEIAGDEPGEFFSVRGELEFTTLTTDVTYNIPLGRFSPFVVGAIGWSWVDTNIATEPPEVGCWWDPWWGYVCTSFQDTRTIDGFTYQLGLGARFDVNDAFAIHGSYRMTWIDFDNATSTPDIDGFTLSVGWKF